jgi:glycosyltransferase involved in cell wall biosynthesis
MADGSPVDSDVTYVGLLMGHGGDALQMLALANGVKERGARVHIVLPEVPSSVTFRERCGALGISCDRTPLLSVSMDGARQRLSSIVKLLRSIRSPIVHFHTGNSCLPRTVMASLELLRYRSSFVTVQSPYETIIPGSPRARMWSAMARRRLGAVVSPSKHATDFQLRCGIPAAVAATVRNSIDVTAFSRGDGQEPRAMLNMAAEDPVVLFCSRIDPQKRPVEAVRIFAGVAAEFPTAILVFVGQGEEEAAVRTEAARLGVGDRLRLVGYQTNIPSWLAASTVWLLPTERENFSVAVLEAMAAGCAILSTSCQGNDEVLVNGENSLTFAVGDVDLATDALRLLLRDSSLRDRLRCGAVASVQEYGVDKMVERYRVIYNRSEFVPACLRG